MPPGITYSKEMILSAAGQIIRNDGIEKLNARSIAQAIGGSTQPIYRCLY